MARKWIQRGNLETLQQPANAVAGLRKKPPEGSSDRKTSFSTRSHLPTVASPRLRISPDPIECFFFFFFSIPLRRISFFLFLLNLSSLASFTLGDRRLFQLDLRFSLVRSFSERGIFFILPRKSRPPRKHNCRT